MKLDLNTNFSEFSDILLRPAKICLPILEDEKMHWPDKLVKFIESMKDVLSNISEAKALAANQVWRPNLGFPLYNVFVMKFREGIYEFINPLVKGTGKSLKEEEGCLSFPNHRGKLKRRHKNAVVVYHALTEPEKQFVIKFGRLEARAVQHEFDHLRGKTLYHLKPKIVKNA